MSINNFHDFGHGIKSSRIIFKMACFLLLGLVSAYATAESSALKKINQHNQYKQVDDSCDPINTEVDGGKHCAICQAYLKVLNALDEPVQCDIPTNPQFNFYPIEWKKLDPWADPKLLYGLDTYARPNARQVLPGDTKPTSFKKMTFEQWKWSIEQEIAEGRILPGLAESSLDLNGDGKIETVLGYTTNPQGCKNAVAKGYSSRGGLFHLFIRSSTPPGFDVEASKKIGAYRKFTPMRHDGRIYAGASYWGGAITRESEVRLNEFWGKPIHATMYCHYKMPLSLELLEELEEKTHDHNQ